MAMAHHRIPTHISDLAIIDHKSKGLRSERMTKSLRLRLLRHGNVVLSKRGSVLLTLMRRVPMYL